MRRGDRSPYKNIYFGNATRKLDSPSRNIGGLSTERSERQSLDRHVPLAIPARQNLFKRVPENLIKNSIENRINHRTRITEPRNKIKNADRHAFLALRAQRREQIQDKKGRPEDHKSEEHNAQDFSRLLFQANDPPMPGAVPRHDARGPRRVVPSRGRPHQSAVRYEKRLCAVDRPLFRDSGRDRRPSSHFPAMLVVPFDEEVFFVLRGERRRGLGNGLGSHFVGDAAEAQVFAGDGRRVVRKIPIGTTTLHAKIYNVFSNFRVGM